VSYVLVQGRHEVDWSDCKKN